MISKMTNDEVVFCFILVTTNCVLTYHWAVYGFLESTLDKRTIKPMFWAGIVNVATIIIAAYLQKWGYLTVNVLSPKNNTEAILYVLIPPLIFMVLVRLWFSKSGVPEYNRARTATQFWTTKNIQFGHVLKTEGENLKNFPRAMKALENFDKSIRLQKKGSVSSTASTTLSIADKEPDYNGFYNSQCPGCNFQLKVPDSKLGTNGVCNMCGSHITAKTIANTIYISAFGKFAKRTYVSKRNKVNIATALSEKALLLRMMNRFDEAESCTTEALEFVESVLCECPEEVGLLSLKSLIIFRAAEIAHVKREKTKAKSLYEQCLRIDKLINRSGEDELVKGLLNSL